MDAEDTTLPPLEALVDSLLDWAAVTGQMIEHMHRSQAVTGRETPTIPEVLYSLLCGTLEPLAERRMFEVGVAARVVQDAVETVMEEIYLMPIEEHPRPDRGHCRPPRRRRRGT